MTGPGCGSADAVDLLEREGFGSLVGFSGQDVLTADADAGVDDRALRGRMEDLVARTAMYDVTGDNARAVADGLARTGRVITAAAIMSCVFSTLVFADQRALRPFGFGPATAVALDATVVRPALVPGTMDLLGDRNRWLPRWLDRLLPTVHVDPGTDDEGDDRGVSGDGADRGPGQVRAGPDGRAAAGGVAAPAEAEAARWGR